MFAIHLTRGECLCPVSLGSLNFSAQEGLKITRLLSFMIQRQDSGKGRCSFEISKLESDRLGTSWHARSWPKTGTSKCSCWKWTTAIIANMCNLCGASFPLCANESTDSTFCCTSLHTELLNSDGLCESHVSWGEIHSTHRFGCVRHDTALCCSKASFSIFSDETMKEAQTRWSKNVKQLRHSLYIYIYYLHLLISTTWWNLELSGWRSHGRCIWARVWDFPAQACFFPWTHCPSFFSPLWFVKTPSPCLGPKSTGTSTNLQSVGWVIQGFCCTRKINHAESQATVPRAKTLFSLRPLALVGTTIWPAKCTLTFLGVIDVTWQETRLERCIDWRRISDQGTALIDATISPFEFAMTVHSIPATSPFGGVKCKAQTRCDILEQVS